MQLETTTMVMADGEDFLAALDDLAATADAIGAQPNPLSLIPACGDAQRTARAAAGFQALAPDAQARLAVALGVLRAPGKMAHWHHSVADESVSRAALAWSSSVPGEIVALAGTVDPRRVSFWTRASVAASIRTTVAAGFPLRDDEIGCKLSTPAVVVLLAALDQARAVRLHSMLVHAAPTTSFSQPEIMDRLRDSAAEDFRWPLLFVEKLIPARLPASLSEIEVTAALAELVQAGLVERAAEGAVLRFELTHSGKVIADGLLHEVSKVALGVTDRQGEGRFGRDVVLLVRSSFHLFMFAMAGQQGAVAALDGDELDAVLDMALSPVPPPEAPSAEAAPPAPSTVPAPPPLPSAQWYLAQSGRTEGPFDEESLRRVLASLPPETMVWKEGMPGWVTAREAGVSPPPAPAGCPHCGAPADPGGRFCGNCGRTLSLS